MTVQEIIYVLDKEKECIIRRNSELCEKQCDKCDSHLQVGTLLNTFEEVINIIFRRS